MWKWRFRLLTRFQAAFGRVAGLFMFLLRQMAFQAAVLRHVMRLTFSGCLIAYRQPEMPLSKAQIIRAILR